ncbi:MAG: hypothetical protein V5A16_00375 [Haloplanus sp.]
MIRTKLVAVVFAALLVTVGTVAAAPGNAPVDVGADDQYDDHAAEENDDHANASDSDGQPADVSADDADENASDAADSAANADASNAERRGPPTDLPAQVPDHVTRIHDLIRSFLDGDRDGSLGDSVSDTTPDGAADTGAV